MRQKKVNSSGTVIFVRDGQNMLIEIDANLITQAHYTDSPGMWGGLASERRGSVSSFYGFDPQSNTRILVSIGGNITDSYLYKAFGEELLVSGTTVNPLRFGGQVGYWRDIASRLYVRHRELDVTTGRWVSRDPIGFDGGDWNLYRYVGNGPVIETDPFGTLPVGLKFCWRPVFPGLPYEADGHWYLKTAGCGCIGYSRGGIMIGKGSCPENKGGWQGINVHCTPLPVTPQQQECLCAEAAYAKGVGSTIGGKQWFPGIGPAPGGPYYNVWGHSCQDFVSSLLKQCNVTNNLPPPDNFYIPHTPLPYPYNPAGPVMGPYAPY